jgi:hypothetical protein
MQDERQGGLTPGRAPETAWSPTALIVEHGAVDIWIRDADGGPNPGEIRTAAPIRFGEHLILPVGTVRIVRNAGPEPAVLLVVAVEPLASPPIHRRGALRMTPSRPYGRCCDPACVPLDRAAFCRRCRLRRRFECVEGRLSATEVGGVRGRRFR